MKITRQIIDSQHACADRHTTNADRRLVPSTHSPTRPYWPLGGRSLGPNGSDAFKNWIRRLSVRPSLRPSVRPFVRPFVRPSVRSSVRSSVSPFFCTSVRPFVNPLVRTFEGSSFDRSVSPFVCSPVRLLVRQFVRL